MTTSEIDEYDVVVVGSGAGALTAAYVAAAGGARTVVVEKAVRLGGTSAYSGAACWLPGTEVQRRAGIEDSTEDARRYLRAVLGTRAEAKQDAFLSAAPALVALLERDPVLEFAYQAFPDYFDAPGRQPRGRSFVPVDLPAEEMGDLRSLVRPPVGRDRDGLGHAAGPLTQGRALIGRLLLALHRTGNGTVKTGWAVDRLLTEGEQVFGVQAQTGSGRRRVSGRLGVLLAAGGFERDQRHRTQADVPGAAAWSMAPKETNAGEPMTAAVDVGAATELMDQAWWCPGLAEPDGGAAFTLGLCGGLIVDGTGRRYANESLPYDQFGRRMQGSPDRVPSYLIFDSRFHGRLPAISLPHRPPQEHLAAGTWVRADSLTALADAIGAPRATLEQTVARFGGFAASGVDEDFGRGQDAYDRFFAQGDGPNPALVPVDTPPYYAARLVLADLGTKGGLCTDTAGRVLRPDGRTIPGLYATGNTAASMTGDRYPGPGIPIGTAMVFGYLAVQDMLAER